MKHVIYTPEDEDNRVVTVFGQTFKAGASVAVSDEVYAKLSENPTFEKGRASAVERQEEPVKVDGRSKEARAAKDDEAKLRAAAHQSDLKEAKAEAAEEEAEKAKR